jgi:truncated hemoglobin YjbI
MSKQELQKATMDASGVSYDESLEASNLTPTLYERIGDDGFKQLSQTFYDKVFLDKESQWFLNIFSSSTKSEAVENQYLFLVQSFGGPDVYRQKKGKYTRLVGRHANYNIGTNAAERWLHHMVASLEEHPQLRDDEEATAALKKYFAYTAHYIVATMQYMRPDQVSVQFWTMGCAGGICQCSVNF